MGNDERVVDQQVNDFMKKTAKVDERNLRQLEDQVASIFRKNGSGGMSLRNTPSGGGNNAPMSGRGRLDALDSARKQLRSQGRPTSRGGGGGGYLKQSGSNNALRQLGFDVVDTGGEGEWLVLAAYNKLQYDKEQKSYRQKILADRKTNKSYLDKQYAQTINGLKAERDETLVYARKQDEELRQWKIDEQVKKEGIMQKIQEEKKLRDEQIREKQRFEETDRAQKRREDQAEIDRCLRAMDAEKEQMKMSKIREQEKLKAILIENEANQVTHQKMMDLSAKEDVDLMKQYADKLKKQDEDRAAGFAKTLHTMDSNTEASAEIKQKEILKAKKLEDTIEMYRREKEANDAAREERDKKKRTDDVIARKRTLAYQLKLQDDEEKKQKVLDRAFAQQFALENQMANKKESDKMANIRRKNIEHQRLLKEQIASKIEYNAGGVPFNTLDKSVEMGGMSFSEKRFNEQLLKDIVQDGSSKREIEDMLNRQSASGSNANQLSNVF